MVFPFGQHSILEISVLSIMQRTDARKSENLIQTLWQRKWPFMMWMHFSRVWKIESNKKEGIMNRAFVCHFNQIVYSSHICDSVHLFCSPHHSHGISYLLTSISTCHLYCQFCKYCVYWQGKKETNYSRNRKRTREQERAKERERNEVNVAKHAMHTSRVP